MSTQTISHEVNIENLEKAIDFISTLEESSFCRRTQKNDVGQHCVLGHLAVNKSSPFYDKTFLDENEDQTATKGFASSCFALNLNNIFFDNFRQTLASLNNLAPEGEIKITVLDALNKLLSNLK
jgi:hypothetical protein